MASQYRPLHSPNRSETGGADTSLIRLEFPRGLFGFEEVKDYRLCSRSEEAPFHWLEMAGDLDRFFLMVTPREVVADYEPELSREDLEFLELNSLAEAQVMSVVTRPAVGQATMNLKSPIIINPALGRGKQIIPRNVSRFTSRYPLALTSR